ncbi:MAG: hypothetical protein OET90_11225, partial [Desulfuromonadales bacterium]|nr:hypothetical protein [Desulfuromonadales bacterium]
GDKTVGKERVVDWGFMGRLYANPGSVYAILCVVALLLVATVGTWSLIVPINRTANPDEFWIAWFVVCAIVTSNFLGKKYESCLIGMNYVPLVNRWNIFFNVCSVLASITVILLGGKILSLVIILLLFSLMNILRNSYLLTRKVEGGVFRDFKTFGYEKDILRHAWSPAWRSGLGILGSTGIVQATGIIYSQVADSQLLASYLLTLKLMTSCAVFSQAPFYSKLPVFARLRSQGNVDALADQSMRAMRIALFVFVFAVFLVALFGNALLVLIDSDVKLLGFGIWVSMSFVWFLERHHAMHAQIYSTTNHIPFYIPIIISGIVNLCLILMLIDKLQIWAFPIAHGISNMMINNWWNVKISLKSIDRGFIEYFEKSALLPTVMFCICCVIVFSTPIPEMIHSFLVSVKSSLLY